MMMIFLRLVSHSFHSLKKNVDYSDFCDGRTDGRMVRRSDEATERQSNRATRQRSDKATERQGDRVTKRRSEVAMDGHFVVS